MLAPDNECKFCKGAGECEHQDLFFKIPCICLHWVSGGPDELVSLIINELGGEEIEYQGPVRQLKGKVKF